MTTKEQHLLVGWATITLLLALLIILTACSAEYIREKPVITDLHEYCLKVPQDSACQKDK